MTPFPMMASFHLCAHALRSTDWFTGRAAYKAKDPSPAARSPAGQRHEIREVMCWHGELEPQTSQGLPEALPRRLLCCSVRDRTGTHAASGGARPRPLLGSCPQTRSARDDDGAPAAAVGPRRGRREAQREKENARRWSATSCSPTGLPRSTIGARGLNFRVRDGTGCASPAMVADQRRAFCSQGPCPQGRTARR